MRTNPPSSPHTQLVGTQSHTHKSSTPLPGGRQLPVLSSLKIKKMDEENQLTFVSHTNGNVGVVSSSIWPTPLARAISLQLTTLTSSTLNNYRVFIDDDFSLDGDDAGDEESFRALLLEECVYSRPFVVLDVVWNLAFVVVAVFVLLTTLKEKPITPLRLWVAGYGAQCLLHLGFVWIDYQTSFFYDYFVGYSSSFMKRLESFNTVISSVWWLLGFYWIVMGGQELLQDSPRLYWLSVVYLGFDLFFMIFCVGMACVMFLAAFCCFPILASVAYAMTMGDGASEDDIRTLPKCKYHQTGTILKQGPGFNLTVGSPNYPELLPAAPEDSECCICLHEYKDGVELCILPCNHHFHYRCIRKWLRINATCPLCKCNMFPGETLV